MAIAIAKALSVSDKDIVAGLQAAEAENGRLCPLAGRNQLQLLDDSYNASPKAVCAAVDVLVALSSNRSANQASNQPALSIAVLADMGELGEETEQQHKNIGQYAAKAGVTKLYAIGDFASHTINAFLADVSEDKASAMVFATQEEMIEQLLSPLCAGANVLIKGSRFTKMENIVKALGLKGCK
jgi:UDP-N-acetylmuramoyl-tripeptide--D-alanyl-D-alanine ligase